MRLPVRTRARSSIRSVAGPSHSPRNGPQRCQASAAFSHCARVVVLNLMGSKVVTVLMLPPLRQWRRGVHRCRQRYRWQLHATSPDSEAVSYNGEMTDYGQFCTVARGAEIFGERWTPLVVRELLCGSTRFNDIRRGVPRMSATLLAQRLRKLEEVGVVRRERGNDGWEYRVTPAGEELRPI